MPEHVLSSVRPVPLNPGEVFLAEPVMIAEEFLGPREGLESPAAEQDSRRVPVEPVRRSDGKSGISGHGPEALRCGILMSRSGLRGQSGRLEDGHKAVLLSDDGEFRQILNRSLRLSGFPGHGLREGRNPHRIAFLHPGEGLHPPSVHAHLTRAYPAVQEALWQPEMALQKADDLKPGLFSAHSQAPLFFPSVPCSSIRISSPPDKSPRCVILSRRAAQEKRPVPCALSLSKAQWPRSGE